MFLVFFLRGVLRAMLTTFSSTMMIAITLSVSILTGCGSGSAAKTQCTNTDAHGACTNPNGGNSATTDFSYKGEKSAATGDVLKFQQELWVKLAPDSRCGSCHSDKTNKQSPMFARSDDINLAYSAAAAVVNLTNPSLSRLVEKVRKGHNCWLADSSACADIITTYVTNWAGNAATAANEVVLIAPAEKDVAQSKNFPVSSEGFATNVHPTLKKYCANCHSESAVTKQQPYFASSDIAVAYDAAKTKIRLDSPAASRLVQRLRSDFHNCWSDCTVNAQEMEDAISAFAAGIAVNPVNTKLVMSKTVGFADAFVLTSGGRVDTNIIAKYEFKSGKGTIVYDTSGIEPAANLNIIGNIGWSSAWGIKIKDNGRAQATTATSRKFYDLIRGASEYSIEAWIIPDNVSQGVNDNNPARIVTFSGSNTERNFTLGQYKFNYSFLNRSDKSDINGEKELHTSDAARHLQATLQHVVVSFDPSHGRRIYVNGEFTGDIDPQKGAVLKDWDSNFALALGNEVSGDLKTLWQGNIRFVGIHNRAMSAEDIKANYKVGVGAKYLLLFNVSSLIGISDSFVVFEVQQLDDYGYLFANPFFTNLKGKAIDTDIALKGIRIGVNGEEAASGQVFANLDTTINASHITNGRQVLSTLGTVVELKSGPDQDQFFLTFDQLGGNSFTRVVPEPPKTAIPADIDGQPLIGLRTFAEINAALSALTGVPTTYSSANADPKKAIDIRKVYLKVQQQLPTLTHLDGFLAAQQMGITQLTVAYCNALVGNSTAENSLRDSYFSGFNFAAAVTTAFDSHGRSQIIEPILQHLLAHEVGQNIGTNAKLNTQAEPVELRAELNNLISKTIACASNNSCPADQTLTTVKATCAAAMGSAVMLLH